MLPGTQGKRAQLMLGFEQVAAGMRAAVFNVALRCMTIAGKVKKPLDRTKNMHPSGRTLEATNELVEIPLKFGLQPDVDSIAPLCANLRRYLSIATPTTASAPTVALAAPAAAGNVDDGAHKYLVTFVSVAGETGPGAVSATVTTVDKTINGKVDVTVIPLGPVGTTARKIYRNTVADPATFKLLTTINDNVTAVYLDNTADAGLGAVAPTTINPAVWTIRDLQDGDVLAEEIDTMSAEFDRNDGIAQLDLGLVLTSREIKIEKNKKPEVTFEGMAQHFTHDDDATMIVTAATYTGKLLHRGNQPEAVRDDIYVKCSTPGALDGTAKVKVKRGAGSTYDGPEYAVTALDWFDGYKEDGVTPLSDDFNDPYQLMFSAGGTLSLNDEFKIDSDRAKYSAAGKFSTRNLLSSAGIRITVGDESRTVDNVTIKTTVDKPARMAVGTKYPAGFTEGEPEVHEITMTRPYLDRDFYELLLTAENVEIEVDMLGDKIGRGDYRERWYLHFRNAQVEDAGGDAETPGQTPETIKFYCHSVDGTEIVCEETIHCTRATAAGLVAA